MILIWFQSLGAPTTGPVFSPPIREYTEPWRKETPHDERRFHARFRGQARAVNVYKLYDGTYTEEDGLDPSLIDIIYRGSTTTAVSTIEAAALEAWGYDVVNA